MANPTSMGARVPDAVTVLDSAFESWMLFISAEIRPRPARNLLERFGSPEAALTASRQQLLSVEGMTEDAANRLASAGSSAAMDHWKRFAQERSLWVLPCDSPAFPPLLREIPDTPAALLGIGSLEALGRTAVAMVGTRAPTEYGQRTAQQIALGLAQAGIVLVSGGALGIDTVVHQAASRDGVTVAVLGCGLDVPYPARNQRLFQRITERGALVTEFPLGARPDAWRFPARNRIISGLCRATLVVEAAERSGALITARFALEQGRDVVAVPGPVHSVQSRGCHGLIRDGALLVENATQVLEVLGWEIEGRSAAPPESVSPPPDLPIDQGALLLALRNGPRHIDELVSECSLSAAQTGAALTFLEMRGLVRRIPGNQFLRL